MGIFSFILGNKNLIILAILAAAFAGGVLYIKILKNDLVAAVAEKNTLTADLGVSQASVKGLQESINEQNSAITKLKSDADAREASHVTEIAKAKETALNYQKQAAALMKLKAPNGKPVCAAADDLINEELKNAK